MNPVILTEDTLAEQPALEWFRELGYEVTFGPDISPGGLRPKRESFCDVVRKRRLRSAFEKLNPHLPQKAIEDALHQLLSLDSPDMFVNNPKFHLMAVNGVKVGNRIVTVGLVNHSLVHPREVFADVITDRAASVILVHNHPSGTLKLSKQDILMIKQLVEAGAILGIKVLKHLIVSKKGHLSMKEKGLL